jgi:hypothetical protein
MVTFLLQQTICSPWVPRSMPLCWSTVPGVAHRALQCCSSMLARHCICVHCAHHTSRNTALRHLLCHLSTVLCHTTGPGSIAAVWWLGCWCFWLCHANRCNPACTLDHSLTSFCSASSPLQGLMAALQRYSGVAAGAVALSSCLRVGLAAHRAVHCSAGAAGLHLAAAPGTTPVTQRQQKSAAADPCPECSSSSYCGVLGLLVSCCWLPPCGWLSSSSNGTGSSSSSQ